VILTQVVKGGGDRRFDEPHTLPRSTYRLSDGGDNRHRSALPNAWWFGIAERCETGR
jgi:hypothetical protein